MYLTCACLSLTCVVCGSFQTSICVSAWNECNSVAVFVYLCVNVLFAFLGEVTSHWFSRNAQRGMNSLSGHTKKKNTHTHTFPFHPILKRTQIHTHNWCRNFSDTDNKKKHQTTKKLSCFYPRLASQSSAFCPSLLLFQQTGEADWPEADMSLPLRTLRLKRHLLLSMFAFL